MRRAPAAFLLALQFLTVIRLRRSADIEPRMLGESVTWFPVVGVLIGLVLVAVDWAARLFYGPPVTVALVLTAAVALTGALHVDGLADTADGVFGGHTREQRLAIMRDSRTGSFGVVAVVLTLLLMYASLLAMSDASRRGTLLAASVLARSAMVVGIARFPYARSTGLGRLYKDNLPPRVLLSTTALSFALSALMLPLGGIFALLPLLAIATALLTGFSMSRRLGGLTGDVYGAIGVVTEAVIFLAVAASQN